MKTLKEFTEVLREALKIYEEWAESNGQDGDVETYDRMMEEHREVTKYCDKLEEEYNLHQRINAFQLYFITIGENKELSTSLNSVLETYSNYLGAEERKIREKRERIKEYQEISRG